MSKVFWPIQQMVFNSKMSDSTIKLDARQIKGVEPFTN